jgi:hypothetical protein
VSRLSRLSARAYGRLTPEQRRAVDQLRYSDPNAAERGELKTTLGWKRTAEETAAYARNLIAGGMMVDAAAGRLGVEADHLRRLLSEDPAELERRSPARSGRELVDRWLADWHRIMEHYPELCIDAIDRAEADAERHFAPEADMREVSDVEKPARKPFIHQEKSGLTDKTRPTPLPLPDSPNGLTDKSPNGDRPVYDGDPVAYDFEAALRRTLR